MVGIVFRTPKWVSQEIVHRPTGDVHDVAAPTEICVITGVPDRESDD
jgi:hypothetical protein